MDDWKIDTERLRAQVANLTIEVKCLSHKVKDLTKYLLNASAAESTRMDMFLRSLTPKPPST